MLAMMLVLWYNFALEISNFSLSFGELLSRKFRIFMNFLLVNIDDFHRVYFLSMFVMMAATRCSCEGN